MKQRNASFELLRILAITMVIVLHALGHGGILNAYEFGHFGYILGWSLKSFCLVAVNCFVLITGYFMVNSQMKLSRLLKLIIQVWFYSVICLVVTKVVFKQPVGLKALICVLFPLTGNQYWCATAYAVLLAVTPLLNKFIKSMTRKEHFTAILLLVTVFSVVPTILFWGRSSLGSGYDFVWFVVLYFIASYIRLYGLPLTGKKCILGFLIAALLALASNLVMGIVTKAVFGMPKRVNLLFDYNSVLFLPASVFLFVAFSKWKVNGKLANTVAKLGKYVFGAYLISDHALIRTPLWKTIDLTQMAEKGLPAVLGYIVLVVLCIVVAGCVVEWLRSFVEERIGIHKLFAKMDALLDKIVEGIQKRIP